MHIPLLRIVPDDTKFDFMRFRRISFPISAVLSIVAMLLFFFNGLNFGVDFVGGTLIEVQSKTGPADLARMRATMSYARPRRRAVAAIRRADRRSDPRSAAARRRRRAAGGRRQGARRARQRRRIPARRGGRPARLHRASGLRHRRPDDGDPLHPGLSLVPVRMAIRARRDDRQRARSRADDRIHVAHADRLRPDQHRGAC